MYICTYTLFPISSNSTYLSIFLSVHPSISYLSTLIYRSISSYLLTNSFSDYFRMKSVEAEPEGDDKFTTANVIIQNYIFFDILSVCLSFYTLSILWHLSYTKPVFGSAIALSVARQPFFFALQCI